MIPALALLIIPQASEPVHAFVELVAEPAKVFVEQPLRVTVRFGVEEQYLRHNLLQLFTRPLDVPVQLELPWRSGPVGALPIDPGADPGAADPLVPHPSFALGEEIVRAERSRKETREGQTFVVLEIERAFLPTAPGRLEIPAPVLHYAFATRFDDNLVSGSVPLDRSTALVQGKLLAVEVAALPVEGRPAGFVDAVGEFTLTAEAAPLELAAGESVKLTLVIEGRGNLAQLSPPRLDGLAGLHLLASSEELAAGRRTLHAEFVPDSARTREIPSVALAYFDPRAGEYRIAKSSAIPLKSRGNPPVGEPGASFRATASVYLLLAGLALLFAALAWGATRLRRRR